MKKKFLSVSTWASALIFIIFVGLYIYVSIANPNPIDIIKIREYPPYDGGKLHFTAAKHIAETTTPHLIIFNQRMPFWGVRAFPFSGDDKITIQPRIFGYGIQFGTGTHSTAMMGCSENDQTGETYFDGYGIFYCDIFHSIDKDKTWWTLMISLWYPIFIFSILPIIFAIKMLRFGVNLKNHSQG